MKRYTLAVLCLVLMMQAQAQQPYELPIFQNDSVTITGQYRNFDWEPGSLFTVTTYDMVSCGEVEHSTPIDRSGNFRITFPLSIAGPLYLDWDRLLEITMGIPGDSVHLVIDLDDYADMDSVYDTDDPVAIRQFHLRKQGKMQITGKYAKMHQEVLGLTSIPPAENPHGSDWSDKIKDEHVYMDSISTHLDRKLAMLEAYDRTSKLLPVSRQFLEATFRYEAVNNLSQFQHKLPRGQLFSDTYIQKLKQMASLDDSYGFLAREYMFYIRDIYNYSFIRVAASRQMIDGKERFITNPQQADSAFNAWFPAALPKQLTAAWNVKNELDRNAAPMTPEQVAAFEKKVSHPLLRHTIYQLNSELVKANADTISLQGTQMITSAPEFKTSAEVFDFIVQSHKGKVIYMDIWGTWCGPCRSEMKYVPSMKEVLKDKDVVYIYFASSSPELAWKNMIKQYKLTGPNVIHYNLPPEQQRLFEKAYLNTGWPTYILVDKKGKMVTKKAPRPSEPTALETAINKLL